MPPTTLEPEASYGKLRFDHFILEKWDVNSAQGEDVQRTSIADQWLALTQEERLKYSNAVQQIVDGVSPALTFAQVALCQSFLEPAERNLSVYEPGSPLWLRTCYLSESDERHTELLDGINDGLEVFTDHPLRLLDDQERWDNLNDPDDLKLLFRRSIDLVDSQMRGSRDYQLEMLAKAVASGDSDAQKEHSWVGQVVIADEQAFRRGWLRLIWFDEHGKTVLDNRIRPLDLWDLAGARHSGLFLSEINNCKDGDLVFSGVERPERNWTPLHERVAEIGL
ncbi:MAG: hypothetical protein M1814_000969 [Vezdaea aestivalis]|nr:MAG: hypothetical protein M1814_000969 [Vezdaea aestivalis]